MKNYTESEIKIREAQSDMEIRFIADSLGGTKSVVSIGIRDGDGNDVLVDTDDCYAPFSMSMESTKVLINFLQTLVDIYEKK